MDSQTILRKLENKPIVFVGMMGCGKSHVAQVLGRDLGLDTFDSDEIVEWEAGRNISDIMADFGEAFFRDEEAEVIARLLDKKNAVIATGGGALMRDETRKLILERSVSIWIDTDLDILMTRLEGDETRPLLAGDQKRDTLFKLLESRLPLYRQAHIHVQNNGGEADVMSEIERALMEYL